MNNDLRPIRIYIQRSGMGVPKFFSHIVKNYPTIISMLRTFTLPVDNFYIDSNSTIYDEIADFQRDAANSATALTNEAIANSVIRKLEALIVLVAPRRRTIIAFDGVAPKAKMDHQRPRRAKSEFQTEIMREIGHKSYSTLAWNTIQITPGHPFMNYLDQRIYAHFADNPQVIVSGTDQPGEGEHKITQFVRNHAAEHAAQTTFIYGLDADLFMLSLGLLKFCPRIWLFRETPHFIRSLSRDLDPAERYILDIAALAAQINGEMGWAPESSKGVADFIALTFILGNDFMPKFPAINIRTGGIDKLIAMYAETPLTIVNDDAETVNWGDFRRLVGRLAEAEEGWLRKEHATRDRKATFGLDFSSDDADERYKCFERLPSYDRDVEKQINPFRPDWQRRYYTQLLHCEPTEARIGQICANWLEGFEWSLKYYMGGCPNWRWSYKYHYPPLLRDLYRYTPVFAREMMPRVAAAPVDRTTQLCYVMPKRQLGGMISRELYAKLMAQLPQYWNDGDPEFEWAYCQYFWESHVNVPKINLEKLERVIRGV